MSTGKNIGYDPTVPENGRALVIALSGIIIFGVAFYFLTVMHMASRGRISDWWDLVYFMSNMTWDRAAAQRLFAALVIASGGSALAWSLVHQSRDPIQPFEVLDKASPEVSYGRTARARLRSRLVLEAGSSAEPGIYLAPRLNVPRSLETKNFFVIGTTGSGKSNIIRGLAEQFIDREDRVLMLCNKGDVTSRFAADDAILIAAHHHDGYALDLAADINDVASAMQFAAEIIPESSPQFWSDSARTVLTDVILAERLRNPDWTATTLFRAVLNDAASIKHSIERIRMSARQLLGADEAEDENKTVASILLTMHSAVYARLRPLAWAWENSDPRRRFSVRKWLSKEATDRRPVIVQYSPNYSDLSTLVAGGLIKRIATLLADPQLENDENRRVVLVLDEFHVLERIPGLLGALAVGRERGLVVVLGTQNISQIFEKYPGDEGRSFLDFFQFKIFSRMDPGANTQYLVDLIGQQRVRVRLENRDPAENDKRKYVSKFETIPAFAAPRFANELGVFKQANGSGDVVAIVSAYGQVYQLRWKFTFWGEQRKGFIAAPWLTETPSASPESEIVEEG